MEPLLGSTRVYHYLSNLLQRRFPELSSEIWKKLGPEVTLPSDVEDYGEGRYGFTDYLLVFSTRDGSNPTTNGRRYQLRVPRVLSPIVLIPPGLSLFFSTALLFPKASSRIHRRWEDLYTRTQFFRNTVPGFILSTLLIAVLFVAGEIALRAHIPFTVDRVEWISDPDIGTSLMPDSEVFHTNHLEYWSRSTVNSLGFADREPDIVPDDAVFRIAVVGDSFVAGLEVEMHEKFPVLLEKRLQQKFPDRPIDIVALGQNGTGQSESACFS